jgi:hypothetical protein
LVHSSWTVDYFQFIYFPWSFIVQSSWESLFWWQSYWRAVRVGTENLMWQCESYKALDQLGVVELCVALFLTTTFWSGTGLENYATLLFCFFYNTIFLNLVNFSVWSWQIKAECLCSGIKLAMWIYIWTSLHTHFSIILCRLERDYSISRSLLFLFSSFVNKTYKLNCEYTLLQHGLAK